jgi:polyvinyl alcohol dehydrogenase (cytochrome)
MLRWQRRSGYRVLASGVVAAVAVAVAVLAGSVSASAPAGAPAAVSVGGGWPTAGRSIGNTRDAADEHVISPGNASRLATAWSITTAGDVTTTPTAGGGVVYFPDFGGKLWAVSAGSGKVLWSQDVSGYTGVPGAVSRTSPAVYGNELVLGDTSTPGHGAFVFAVDRRTGRLLWRTQVDAHPAAIITSSAVIYRGVAYVGVSSDEELLAAESGYQCCTFRGSVVALNAATGRLLWQRHTVPAGYSGGAVWGSTPAIGTADDMLYVGTGNNYSAPPGVCVSPGQTGCTPPAADDHADSVLALDLATGAIRWYKSTLSSDVFTDVCGKHPNAVCGPDFDFGSGPNLIRLPSGRQLLGIGQKSGVYWALDPRTGAVAWTTLVGPGSALGGIEWGSATDGRHVYAAISDFGGTPYQITSAGGQTSTITGGSWAALDAATGRILWQVADPQHAADLGYVSIANGLVYAGSTAKDGDDMYVLDAATGRILWSFASGGPVTSGAAIVRGMVYWGSGAPYATRCPGGTGPLQACSGSNDKIYAFSLGRPGR